MTLHNKDWGLGYGITAAGSLSKYVVLSSHAMFCRSPVFCWHENRCINTFRPLHSCCRNSEALSAWADRFQSLPLFFMKFHGGTDVDAVLDAMDYAVYAHDVQHIILDNLQFMLTRGVGGNGRRSGGSWDKFDAQVCGRKWLKVAESRRYLSTTLLRMAWTGLAVQAGGIGKRRCMIVAALSPGVNDKMTACCVSR